MADLLSRRPSDFMEDEMERMMRRFFGRPVFSASGEGFWHPPVDIHITDKSVLVRIDIPGIDPKDVEISIEDNRLLVRGKRIACEEAVKNEQCWYNETKRGDFHRVIDLPGYVDSTKTNASSENGVLTIKMSKKKEAETKVIKVQTK
ncbi:MAG: Hsp20/alpha crystallin family protein [Planctomycetes bacterium]|nr:Hsp20/alpha crystallin family protein [Planctomycetota bacterium]